MEKPTRLFNQRENIDITIKQPILVIEVDGTVCKANKALDNTHLHVTSSRNYNNENALAAAVYIAFVHALNYYNCFKELSTGKGFADLVYVPVVKSPEHPAVIIELKINESTGKALQQIQNRQYFDALDNYKGNLLFVAINYDKDTKKHECEITEWEK